uniref:Uncharacterized protein n=1 Tax=Strigamia maritima TaxID=126957 RepID=T1JA30_STRMM
MAGVMIVTISVKGFTGDLYFKKGKLGNASFREKMISGFMTSTAVLVTWSSVLFTQCNTLLLLCHKPGGSEWQPAVQFVRLDFFIGSHFGTSFAKLRWQLAMSNQGQPEGEVGDASYQGISQAYKSLRVVQTLNKITFDLDFKYLLNNIARDLDHMLNELGQGSTLPSPIGQTDEFSTSEEGSHYRRATGLPTNQQRIRNNSGDALLEQFVQTLIDSLTLPGTPFDGRTPVQSPDLCPLELNGVGGK